MIQEIGIILDRWEEQFKLYVKAFEDTKGNITSSNNSTIYGWITKQRANNKQNELSSEQKKKLLKVNSDFFKPSPFHK
jgi:hypothetical protein